MLKKVITTLLSFCLILSINAMSVTAAGEAQQGEGRGGMPPMGQMPSGNFAPPEGFEPPASEFTPPSKPGEFTPQQNPEKVAQPQSEESGNTKEIAQPQSDEDSNTKVNAPKAEAPATEGKQEIPQTGEQPGQTQGENQQFGDRMPGGMGGFSGNMQNFNGQTQEDTPKDFPGFVKTYSTPITSVVLLGLAFVFVIFYRRKNY